MKSLFRRHPHSVGASVTIRLFAPMDVGDVMTGSVTWSGGNEWLAPFLPTVLFDKFLANARGADADDLRASIYEFARECRDDWNGDVDEATAGVVPPRAPGASEIGHVRADVAVTHLMKNLGVATHFKPMRAANPTFAEATWWVAWDWTCNWVATNGEPDDVFALIENTLAQAIVYETEGKPSTLQVGFQSYEVARYMAERRRREGQARPLLDSPFL